MKNSNGIFEQWIDQAIEIELTSPDDFLKIKETLTRMGIGTVNRDGKKTLYQSCHIFQKRGRYYIVHFKELLFLDGKTVNISIDDIKRRNLIIKYLQEWALCKVLNGSIQEQMQNSAVRVIPFKDKSDWLLVAKYTIGQK